MNYTCSNAHNEKRFKVAPSPLSYSPPPPQFLRLLQLPPSEGGGRGAAVSYAQRHLAPFSQTHMSDIKRLMGCLLFAARLGKSPYADLVAPQRWWGLLCTRNLLLAFFKL